MTRLPCVAPNSKGIFIVMILEPFLAKAKSQLYVAKIIVYIIIYKYIRVFIMLNRYGFF